MEVVMRDLLKKSIVLLAVFPLISLYASSNNYVSFRGEEREGGYHPSENREGGYHPSEYNREGGYGAGGYHPEARGFEQGAASGYEQGANNANQNQNPVIIEQQPAPENPYDSNPNAGY
jgi:hypothetical protein